MIGEKVDSHQRARDVLESLLRNLKDGKLTGEYYVRVTANQGGVRSAESCRAVEGMERVVILEPLR